MQSKPTLFLDRDGVINQRTPDDYVKQPSEFIPAPGAIEAIGMLAEHFGRIAVVTNQAGIGKGLMTEADLGTVHREMLALVQAAGGRIDGVYFCPHRPELGCGCRKPAPGMVLQAQADFPEIDFQNAWLVGDSATDMELGQALDMKTVLIAGKFEETERLEAMVIDYRFESLLAFARFISGK